MPPLTHQRLQSVTSRQNPLVKQLRHAISQGEPSKDGHIAVEGVRLIEEAIRSGLRLRALFFSESFFSGIIIQRIGVHPDGFGADTKSIRCMSD